MSPRYSPRKEKLHIDRNLLPEGTQVVEEPNGKISLMCFSMDSGTTVTPPAELVKLSAGDTTYLETLEAALSTVKEVIVDLGLQKSIKGSKLYAALKGVVDAGIMIPHSEEILPGEGRLKGEHIQKNKDAIIKSFEDIKGKLIGN